MSDLINAAKINDLQSLRHALSINGRHIPLKRATTEMQDACEAAALAGHPAAVELFIDSGCWISPDVVCATLEGRSKDVFNKLIAKGWDVNLNLGHLGDALILATGSSDLDMVQFLLSQGADPNANTDGGMYRAIEQGAAVSSIPVLEALLNAGAETRGRSVLSKAAYWGRADVAFLLDRGLTIDEDPNNNDLLSNAWELGVKNALCTAASRGNSDVVQLLLDRGADAGVRDSRGRSALELAEAGKNEACVNLMREHICSSCGA